MRSWPYLTALVISSVMTKPSGTAFDFAVDSEGVLSAFVTSVGYDLGPYYFLGSSNRKGAYMVVAALEM